MIVCKYKFDKSIYENFIPAFDDGYEGYTVSDEVDNENSNYVIRTIECDSLPTRIRFGSSNGANFKPQRDSLLELIYLNTTNIVNMTDMFAQCINLISINTEGWDTSNVITMYTMFYGCKNLTSLDLSNFITSNVTTMGHMFYNCTNLTSITFGSNFNTSNVTSMSNMFNGCTKLTSLDVSNFNTGKVTSMYGMFTNCKNLTSLDVSNWNTSKVTNMGNMFSDCTNLTSLDLSNFDTSKVTSIQQMFYNCYSLTSLDVSNFNTSEVTDMNSMFRGCKLLTSLNVSNWDTSNVKNMGAMFMECFCVFNLNLSNFDTSKVTTMRSMFQNCINLTSLDISNFDTSKVTDMAGMFGSCKSLPMLNLLNIDATLAKTDNALHYLVNMDALHTLILGEKSLCDSITTWNGMISVESFPGLEKLICPNADYINKLAKYLPDRSSESNQGVIVTNATISDEAMNTISSKNWSLRKMVAQYRYDANTYENLIPEFNTEFSSDKYEIYDSVSEIIIDNIKWMSLPSNNYPNNVRSNYIPVLSNITYNFNCNYVNVQWLDKDKKEISNNQMGGNNPESYVQKYLKSPINAKYLRVSRGEGQTNITISAKLITRSIESVNGDLPTLMRFGQSDDTNISARCLSLMKVLDINCYRLNTLNSMFKHCENCDYICKMNITSIVSDMQDVFCDCQSLTSLDVSNWDTSNVTVMQGFVARCNKLTELDVSSWNINNVTNMTVMFYDCTNLTSLNVSNWETGKVRHMQSMFSGCNKLTSLDVSNFDTSNVTTMQGMFSGCKSLTSLDVSNFDTSEVISMQYMFQNCANLIELDVSNFNTSKVTNMNNMFYNCNKLTSLDVSNFDTSNVTTMQDIFNACNKLTSLDVSNWDTSKVSNMNNMFYNCDNLTSLDVSNWNTSNVTTMSGMFYNCYNLTSLDVSNWNTSKVINMYRMFRECRVLSNLDLSRWNLSASIGDLFVNANSLKSIRMGSFKQTNQGVYVWYSCDTLEYIDINKMNITQVYEGMFESQSIKCIRCNVETSIPFIAEMILDRTDLEQGKIITSVEVSSETLSTLQSKNWTVVSDSTLTKVAEYVYDSNTWNSMIPTFNSEFVEYFIDDIEDENGLVTRTISSMGELPTLMRFGRIWVSGESTTDNRTDSLLEILNMDTSELTSCSNMFRYNKNLTSITCNWNTSNVTNTFAMFQHCTNLTSIDISNWNTSNVTNMSGTFRDCNNLTTLDLSNWNTSNVTIMSYMFKGCTNLTSLDVSNWNTSNVTDMSGMFAYCKNLTSLDISNFNTSNVTDFTNIFTNTPLLTNIGMLYCSPSTINTIASNLPTTHIQTIWVQDTKPNEYTVVSGVEFKEYKENSVMINLSSPLLQGDRIEVKDGKLCHYHKMGKVVLDGSEDEGWFDHTNTQMIMHFNSSISATKLYCSNLANHGRGDSIYIGTSGFGIAYGSQIGATLNEAKQWLQQNPTTVVYQLAKPYYEDITPIQSKLTLETYLECNMNIYTNLPIKTNLTYLTNIANTSSIEEEINAINEGTDLTNLLDDEINN